MAKTIPYRNKMWSRKSYDELDEGIRFPVKVLHAALIDTCQSCQGGKGHSYTYPTIDLPLSEDNTEIFRALAALHAWGIPVFRISVVWDVGRDGTPFEKIGRIELCKTVEDRASENPNPIFSYQFHKYVIA